MTITEPAKPAGSFGEFITQAPASMKRAAASPFTLELFANGTPIGWLGEDSKQWCIVTSQSSAVSIQPYVDSDVTYYQNAANTSRWLSVSASPYYVGFYNWTNARGWKLEGDKLISLYSNQQLSFWSTGNGYVYANNSSGYTLLTVRLH
jgi:hypothetical protein